MTDTLTILTAARNMITDPAMWYKGGWTESGKWDDGGPCCATCALRRAAFDANKSRCKAIGHIKKFTPNQISLAAFNDRPSTTHADVMAVFDRAIAALEVKI